MTRDRNEPRSRSTHEHRAGDAGETEAAEDAQERRGAAGDTRGDADAGHLEPVVVGASHVENRKPSTPIEGQAVGLWWTSTMVTAYGVVALAFMMVMYALENRGPVFVAGFALGCALSSGYGFVSGAWPFGVVEAIWCVIAIGRYRALLAGRSPGSHTRSRGKGTP